MIANALRVLAGLIAAYCLWRIPLYWEAMTVGAISPLSFLMRGLIVVAVVVTLLKFAGGISRKQSALNDIEGVF